MRHRERTQPPAPAPLTKPARGSPLQVNRGPEFLSAQVSYGTKLEQIRSVASRGRQQQAAAAVGGDFGGGRGFLAADDVAGSSRQGPRRSRSPASHPGRRAGQRHRRRTDRWEQHHPGPREQRHPGPSHRRRGAAAVIALGLVLNREAVLLLQDPLVLARVDDLGAMDLRQVALRQVEAEAVLLGGQGFGSHPATPPWPLAYGPP